LEKTKIDVIILVDKFMNKFYKIILPVLFLFIFVSPVIAQEKINLYFFYGDGCPHCAKEEKFLKQLEQENKNIDIYRFEVWQNRQNAQLLSRLAKELKLDISGVPLLIIGDRVVAGYYSAETTGRRIKAIINDYTANGCTDIVAPVIKNIPGDSQCVHGCDDGDEPCLHNCGCQADEQSQAEIPEIIKVPLLGEIKTKDISLPALTILIAAIDGFNPCAMWVLLFLISLLLGMQDRKRMWILGSTFIVASGIVYFLFLSAWLNLFLFLGLVLWLRIIIALVALASGSYHLKEYWLNPTGVCKVTKSEKRKKVFDRLKQITQTNKFWLALVGIILLAFAVNLVELICSAGLPAVYTQILALANLANWQYYGYLLIYIIIFMLDDLFVFFIAMITLQITGISTKYTRWSNLVGGIIMVIIGVLLLFKPGWLMFG